MGERPASARQQLAALGVGCLGGLVLYVAGPMIFAVLLPSGGQLWVLWLCVAASAYFLAAPASWRGLLRRTLILLGASLVLFAVLGYGLGMAGVPAGGMPDLDPIAQGGVLLAAAVALLGARALRHRRVLPAA